MYVRTSTIGKDQNVNTPKLRSIRTDKDILMYDYNVARPYLIFVLSMLKTVQQHDQTTRHSICDGIEVCTDEYNRPLLFELFRSQYIVCVALSAIAYI